MIGIIDYGVGNLFSLKSSFSEVGAEAFVSGNPEQLATADRLILPGVGAFGDAANKLRQSGLDRFVLDQAAAGKPLMGICLGMQLLFEDSYEYGHYQGLGLLKGSVVPMEGALPEGLKIPHIGWNSLHRLTPTANCWQMWRKESSSISCIPSMPAAVMSHLLQLQSTDSTLLLLWRRATYSAANSIPRRVARWA